MKNILVTGGAGYIGSHIIELLVKRNFKVFIIDNLSTGHKKLVNKKVTNIFSSIIAIILAGLSVQYILDGIIEFIN